MKGQICCITLVLSLLFCVGCGISPGPGEESAEQRRRVDAEALRSLGYVHWVPVTDETGGKSGVTRYDVGSAHVGLNLFNVREASSAQLMSMDGRVLHQWSSAEKGRTYRLLRERRPWWMEGWNHVELAENGDLLVIGSHQMLLRLDWESNLEWKADISAHHDLFIDESGNVHVLVDGIRTVDFAGQSVTFQDNYIAVLTADGEPTGRISIFDALQTDPFWRATLLELLSTVRS